MFETQDFKFNASLRVALKMPFFSSKTPPPKRENDLKSMNTVRKILGVSSCIFLVSIHLEMVFLGSLFWIVLIIVFSLFSSSPSDSSTLLSSILSFTLSQSMMLAFLPLSLLTGKEFSRHLSLAGWQKSLFVFLLDCTLPFQFRMECNFLSLRSWGILSWLAHPIFSSLQFLFSWLLVRICRVGVFLFPFAFGTVRRGGEGACVANVVWMVFSFHFWDFSLLLFSLMLWVGRSILKKNLALEASKISYIEGSLTP